MKLSERFQSAWNAFRDQSVKDEFDYEFGTWAGVVTSVPPETGTRRIKRFGNERSIINAVINRIAVDAAAIEIHHVRLDENGRFQDYMNTSLEECLDLNANADQTGRAFRQDMVQSVLDEGIVCVAPIETNRDPNDTDSYDIYSLRVCKIVQWAPTRVKIDAYDERDGRHKQIWMNKSDVAIVENPFFSVMNDANSTLRRIVRKLNTLDVVDVQIGANKLDLLIQLPYQVRSEAQRARAQQRQKDIEVQLSGSKYGIAYIDATEKVTQLNRSIENNLLSQVQYLTDMFYSQLGITMEIMNGTANEATMLNYYNRTIAALLNAFCDEFRWKFLTKTARTQGQSIEFYRNPFELVPVGSIADIADKFTRNEILSSNEMRGIIGFKPVMDERADELRNKNLNQSKEAEAGNIEPVTTKNQGSIQHSFEGGGKIRRLLGTGLLKRRR